MCHWDGVSSEFGIPPPYTKCQRGLGIGTRRGQAGEGVLNLRPARHDIDHFVDAIVHPAVGVGDILCFPAVRFIRK